jgi:hypothetical protein
MYPLMNEQIKLFCTYTGILFSPGKERNSDICYNMDEHRKFMPSKINQSQK